MRLIKEINLLERVDRLIRTKSTGTPAQFAEKLGVSEREIYRILAELRLNDVKIAYCRIRGSYYYKTDTFMKFQACIIENGEERKITGGEDNFNFFENYFQTAKFWQSGNSSLQ